MPTNRVNGIRIYWEIHGDNGDPMVLVHGSWSDHDGWASVVPVLSRTFRVLVYDRRGHSRTERPEGQGSVHEDVADLTALVTELEHFPAHIVGSSFGGAIALRLATERPELFRSLIVHEPPLFGLLKGESDVQTLSDLRGRIDSVVAILSTNNFAEGARQFVESIAFGPGGWQTLTEEMRETFVSNAPTWLDEMRDPDVFEMDIDALRKFEAPTMVTQGDLSPSFFQLIVSRVVAAIPGARTWTYPATGHGPQLSNPDEYVRVVSDFIDSVGSTGDG